MTKKVEVRGGKQWRSKIHALDKSYRATNFVYLYLENFDCPDHTKPTYNAYLVCYAIDQVVTRVTHGIALHLKQVRTFDF